MEHEFSNLFQSSKVADFLFDRLGNMLRQLICCNIKIPCCDIKVALNHKS